MNTGPSSPSLFSQLVLSAKSSIHHIIHPHDNNDSNQDNTATNKDNSSHIPDHERYSHLTEQQLHLEELKQRQRQELEHRHHPSNRPSQQQEMNVPLESLAIEHDDGEKKYQLSVPVPHDHDPPRFHLDDDEDEHMKLYPSFPNDPTVPAPGELTYPRDPHLRHSTSYPISNVHSPSSSNSFRVMGITSWAVESTPSSPQYSVYSSAASSVGATPATGMSPKASAGSFMFPVGGGGGGHDNGSMVGDAQYLTPAQRRRMSMGDVDQYQRKQNRVRQYPQTVGPPKMKLNEQIDENESEEQPQQLPFSSQQVPYPNEEQTPPVEFIYPTFHYESTEDSPHPYYTPQANRGRRLAAPSSSTSATVCFSTSSSISSISSPAISTGSSSISMPAAPSASVPPPHPAASVYRRSSTGLASPVSNSLESTNQGTSTNAVGAAPADSNHHGVPKTAVSNYSTNGVGVQLNGGGGGRGSFSANPSPPRPDFLNLGDPREPVNQPLPASHPQAARLNAWLAENARLQAQAYAQDQEAMTIQFVK